jgi:hypothetical protein
MQALAFSFNVVFISGESTNHSIADCQLPIADWGSCDPQGENWHLAIGNWQ